jgi:glyoxylase-like metal-dependent hydrolase (beta-lactamase superfamily II)
MLTRRDTMKTLFAVAATAAVESSGGAGAYAAQPLSWEHFPADERGFLRAPILLTDDKEAILIDGGFTLSDGRALAEAIKASGKTLTAVYVSQSDPDYYFGLGPVKAAFPNARFIAAPATVAAINGNVQKKLDTWGPQLKENGPQTLADVVIPTPSDVRSLSLGSHQIEIVEVSGLANRRYLWVPSLKAVFGGVLTFNGLHVWTADTPTPEQRAAWVKALDEMASRQPSIVVAGHMAAGSPTDASAIVYTRDYLLAFEEEVSKAADSAALVAAMTKRYPNAGLAVALNVGAKVAKGEMKWG